MGTNNDAVAKLVAMLDQIGVMRTGIVPSLTRKARRARQSDLSAHIAETLQAAEALGVAIDHLDSAEDVDRALADVRRLDSADDVLDDDAHVAATPPSPYKPRARFDSPADALAALHELARFYRQQADAISAEVVRSVHALGVAVEPRLFTSKLGEVLTAAESQGEFRANVQHQGPDMTAAATGQQLEHKYTVLNGAGHRQNVNLASPERKKAESDAEYKARVMKPWKEKGSLLVEMRKDGACVKQYRFSPLFVMSYVDAKNPSAKFNLGGKTCPSCWRRGIFTIHRLDQLQVVDAQLQSGKPANWAVADRVPYDCAAQK